MATTDDWNYRLPEKFQDGVSDSDNETLAEEWQALQADASGWDYRLPEKFQD